MAKPATARVGLDRAFLQRRAAVPRPCTRAAARHGRDPRAALLPESLGRAVLSGRARAVPARAFFLECARHRCGSPRLEGHAAGCRGCCRCVPCLAVVCSRAMAAGAVEPAVATATSATESLATLLSCACAHLGCIFLHRSRAEVSQLRATSRLTSIRATVRYQRPSPPSSRARMDHSAALSAPPAPRCWPSMRATSCIAAACHGRDLTALARAARPCHRGTCCPPGPTLEPIVPSPPVVVLLRAEKEIAR
jgi:hypothetical protein